MVEVSRIVRDERKGLVTVIFKDTQGKEGEGLCFPSYSDYLAWRDWVDPSQADREAAKEHDRG